MAETTRQSSFQLTKFQIARRFIRDAISISTYGYLAKWLWCFDREYGSLRNIMTMVYGFVCLLWTPRLSPRSISYSIFAVGLYGFFLKWMWWSVNRDYLGLICKSLALLFGAKSFFLIWGLATVLRADYSPGSKWKCRRQRSRSRYHRLSHEMTFGSSSVVLPWVFVPITGGYLS